MCAEAPDPCDSPPLPSHSTRVWVLRGLKVVLAVVILSFVGQHIWSITEGWRHAWQAGDVTVTLHAGWVAAAGALYVVGLSMFALFWRRLLAEAGVPAGRLETLRAHFVGQLGKYVPGKALVIVLRAGMVGGPQHSRVRIALTVVYESVAMMASGTAIALVCLLWAAPERGGFVKGTAAMALGLGIVAQPAVFRRLGNLVSVPFRRGKGDVAPMFRYATLLRGAPLLLAGWLLLGASLGAVVLAIGQDPMVDRGPALVLGAAASGMAAGFLVLFMPSGVGVREFFVTKLLEPLVGPAAAVGAALVLRLVWVAVEVLVAGVLYGWPTARRKSSSAS